MPKSVPVYDSSVPGNVRYVPFIEEGTRVLYSHPMFSRTGLVIESKWTGDLWPSCNVEFDQPWENLAGESYKRMWGHMANIQPLSILELVAEAANEQEAPQKHGDA